MRSLIRWVHRILELQMPAGRVIRALACVAIALVTRPCLASEPDAQPVPDLLPHVALPNAPLESVVIRMLRTRCEGSCPVFSITVRGTGEVDYIGERNVDVFGPRTYRIPVDRVRELVDFVDRKNIWAIKRNYVASVSDVASAKFSISIGSETHEFRTNWGHLVGMPAVVGEFEARIMEVSGARSWIALAPGSLQALLAQGLDPRSKAGAALLARAVANDHAKDELAMLRLAELGAPVEGGGTETWEGDTLVQYTTLDWALRYRRDSLIPAMIAGGALLTEGRTDQIKLDRAFRLAIEGGRIASVLAIWNAVPDVRPKLMFVDVQDYPKLKKVSPVLLALDNDSRRSGAWEGLAIAQWLVELGQDIRVRGADGRTLLEIAAKAGDAPMVRWLLAQGIDPSAPGTYDHVALFATEVEDVALVLLEAGARHDRLDGRDFDFREVARSKHWPRVLAWLEDHPNRSGRR